MTINTSWSQPSYPALPIPGVVPQGPADPGAHCSQINLHRTCFSSAWEMYALLVLFVECGSQQCLGVRIICGATQRYPYFLGPSSRFWVNEGEWGHWINERGMGSNNLWCPHHALQGIIMHDQSWQLLESQTCSPLSFSTWSKLKRVNWGIKETIRSLFYHRLHYFCYYSKKESNS